MLRDFSTLTAAERAQYLDLVAKGDPASLAIATVILPTALADAEAIRDARAVLARQPAATKARASVEPLKAKLAELDRRQGALDAERQTVLTAIAAAESAGCGAKPVRLKLLAANPVVRAVLGRELAAVL